MAPTEQLTLYTAEYSPFAQRVHIALEEANAKYKIHQFRQRGEKPDWYTHVNPLRKVPALTFGGPEVPPDQPSPKSVKLIESMAILEFVADVFPEANLRPKDPILRAKARIFIEIYRIYVHDQFREAFFLAKPIEGVIAALEKLQDVLHPSGFAVGEWSIADAAVAPSLVRMMLFLRTGLGAYSKEDWKRLSETLSSDKFSRLAQYIRDLEERPRELSAGRNVRLNFGKITLGFVGGMKSSLIHPVGPRGIQQVLSIYNDDGRPILRQGR